MAVTFVLGRAGTGKTRHCLDALAARLERDDPHGLILLVPEQASFQMERAVALRAPRQGFWRARVLSFSRLAQQVLDECGGGPLAITALTRGLALREICSRCEPARRVFGAALRTSGFQRQLARLIQEMLHENVAPERLLAAVSRLRPELSRERIEALAEIYLAYLNWLGPERVDPAQRVAALRERLDRPAWLHGAEIWVDGFAGFTAQERETLVALARRARQLTLTLLLDPASLPQASDPQAPDRLRLFQRTEQTYHALRDALVAAGVAIDDPMLLTPSAPPRFASADLVELEASFGKPAAAEVPAAPRDGHVAILECLTQRDELRAAAHFIRRRMAESSGRLRFRDFAIVVRDLSPLADLVAEVFAEYEIPHFLDRRRPLAPHALCRLLPAMLEAARSDLAPAAMARLLRCGLLPLRRAQAERIENYVERCQLRGLSAWQAAQWSRQRQARLFPEDEQDRRAIVAALEPLCALAGREAPPSGAVWARGLLAALEQWRVRERIAGWIDAAQREGRWEAAELHRLAWEALSDLLDNLHDVLGKTALPIDELSELLSSILNETTLGLAPPTLDQVLVGGIERSRHPDVKHVWLMAFNEGIFPQPPARDELLASEERQALADTGLSAPAAAREAAFGERMLAYIALTRASHGLTISYATVAADGTRSFPSPLLADVKQALPGIDVRPPDESPPPVCLNEAARGLLHTSGRAARALDHHRYRLLQRALDHDADRRAGLQWLLRGLRYSNANETVDWRVGENGSGRSSHDPAPAAPNVAWIGSPSQIETYTFCPFKHFAQSGLRLQVERGPDPLPLVLGRVAHDVLAAATRHAMQAAANVNELSDAQWDQHLANALAEAAKDDSLDLATHRPQFTFLSGVLHKFLGELLRIHAARWRRGSFVPLGVERTFGPSREGETNIWPPLELRLADGRTIQITGRIDRFDVHRDGEKTWVLLYDYKSTVDTLKATFLVGQRLQQFIYLLALEQLCCGEHAPPELRGATIAGVLLAPLYPNPDVLDTKYAGTAEEPDRSMYMYLGRGLFARDIIHALDQRLSQSPSPIARMNLLKSGLLAKGTEAISQEALRQRIEQARQTAMRAVEGLVAGRVDVSPLLEKRTLACSRCNFAAVCRFEPVFNRPRLAELALPVLGQDDSDAAGDDAEDAGP